MCFIYLEQYVFYLPTTICVLFPSQMRMNVCWERPDVIRRVRTRLAGLSASVRVATAS